MEGRSGIPRISIGFSSDLITEDSLDENLALRRNSKFLSTDSGSLIKGVVFTTGPFLTLKSRVMAISGIELFCDAKIEGDSCSSDSGKRQNDDCFTGRPFISLFLEGGIKCSGKSSGRS